MILFSRISSLLLLGTSGSEAEITVRRQRLIRVTESPQENDNNPSLQPRHSNNNLFISHPEHNDTINPTKSFSNSITRKLSGEFTQVKSLFSLFPNIQCNEMICSA